MLSRRLIPAFALLAVTSGALAQAPSDDPAETRRALAAAHAEGEAAGRRAERLEADAATASAAANRAAQQTAALAARIQQAEAEIAANQAQIALIDHQRLQLRATLAERQRPLMRLTAALQRLSRRPLAVALLRPGSVEDSVHLRALLEAMLPEVQRRTAALRGEILRGRVLQAQARAAEADLRNQQAALVARRQVLAGLETRERLAARDVSGSADREAERALALAEQARDLGTLVGELDKAGALREQLARLPGPVLRPVRPDLIEAGAGAEDQGAAAAPEPARLASYILPLAGRLVAGFGDGSGSSSGGGQPSRGISIAARAGAQVVAPAAGRVAFAGAYRGYGTIVIIEHPGGWTSLITGLANVDVRVGDVLVAGAPLGITGPGHPVLGLELRQNGQPVNPLDQLRGG